MAPEHRLEPTLGWPHLIALGVGAIVGTGILTLIGVGADNADTSPRIRSAIANAASRLVLGRITENSSPP